VKWRSSAKTFTDDTLMAVLTVTSSDFSTAALDHQSRAPNVTLSCCQPGAGGDGHLPGDPGDRYTGGAGSG